MGEKTGLQIDKQAELNNCTFVKTVLMLLVVLYHSIVFWHGDWFTANPVYTSYAMKTVAEWMNSFHIYGFALVSGYVFYHIKYEQGRYQKFWEFVFIKAKRLLIPYAVIAVLWVIPIQYGFFRYDFVTIIKNFVLAINPNQLWFLLMLFNLFVIFWPLSNFFKKYDCAGILVVIGVYGCSVIGPSIVPNVFMIWRAMSYLPLFYLGFKFRQHGTLWIRRISIAFWLVADVVLFALSYFLSSKHFFLAQILQTGVTFVMHIVGAIMSFAVLQKIADRVNWNNKFFAFLSKRSMAVYLFHQQIIYFFICWLNGLVNPYVNAAVNFVGSLAISLLLATVLLKFKITSIAIGEKPHSQIKCKLTSMSNDRI